MLQCLATNVRMHAYIELYILFSALSFRCGHSCSCWPSSVSQKLDFDYGEWTYAYMYVHGRLYMYCGSGLHATEVMCAHFGVHSAWCAWCNAIYMYIHGRMINATAQCDHGHDEHMKMAIVFVRWCKIFALPQFHGARMYLGRCVCAEIAECQRFASTATAEQHPKDALLLIQVQRTKFCNSLEIRSISANTEQNESEGMSVCMCVRDYIDVRERLNRNKCEIAICLGQHMLEAGCPLWIRVCNPTNASDMLFTTKYDMLTNAVWRMHIVCEIYASPPQQLKKEKKMKLNKTNWIYTLR